MDQMPTSIPENFSDEAVDEFDIDSNDWTLTILPVYFFIISVLGIILNLFVLLVFCLHKKACTVAEIYFCNLAAADLFLMSMLPFWAVNVSKGYNWPFGEPLCKLVPFSINMNAYCSVYILVLVSIDRYLALVHPLTHGRMRRPFYAKLGCVLVWVVFFLLNIPALIYSEVVHEPEINFTTCDLNFPNPSMYLMFEGIRMFIFMIPAFIISFCTLKIIHALRGPLKREFNAQKRERKATTLVLVVLLAFLICWMPMHVVNILLLLFRVDILNGSDFLYHLYYCNIIFTSLALSNSVLNPILYVIVGTNFQTKVKELFIQMRTNLSKHLQTSVLPTDSGSTVL